MADSSICGPFCTALQRIRISAISNSVKIIRKRKNVMRTEEVCNDEMAACTGSMS